MKLTLIRTDEKNQMHMSVKNLESFVERMKTETKNQEVSHLREHLRQGYPSHSYALIHKMPKVHPLAELRRDANGNLTMSRLNGLVMLNIRGLLSEQERQRVKQLAMTMPSTQAAFEGSSGKTVKVLVAVSRPDGTLPQAEDEANQFLSAAFSLVRPPYEALLGVPVEKEEPTVMTGFRMTLDPAPLLNPKAMPFRVEAAMASPSAQVHAGEQLQGDYDLYTQNEHLYRMAAEQLQSNLPEDADENTKLGELARQLCLRGLPEEEAVLHIWAHHRYKIGPTLTEERVRAITAAVYAETRPDRRSKNAKGGVGSEMRQLIGYLQRRYVFRYNTVMGYTEYRPNNTFFQEWQPVDERVVNGFTTDARLAGLDVWDKDVQRFVKSDKIHPFNPIENYLWEVHGKWDGRDHIARLAETVPTTNPDWPRWFQTWMLAMVAQWTGRNRRYGNSVAPLLISSQGYNKSTFCRSLLPEQLQWGYMDNLSLDEKRPVLQAMSQMLLINLDEFNQISARTQEGFLKNAPGLLHRHHKHARRAGRPLGQPPLHRRGADGTHRRERTSQPRTDLRPGPSPAGRRHTLLVRRAGDAAHHAEQPPVPGEDACRAVLPRTLRTRCRRETRRMAHRSSHAAADTESGRPARQAGKPHQLRAHACQHRGHA